VREAARVRSVPAVATTQMTPGAVGELDLWFHEVATTSGTTWDQAQAEHLRGADVLIVRDRDRSGRAKAQKVRQLLIRVAASVRVYDPPAKT
jgi:hypothetical protein